ncbi:TetR/AcrR family transcriptional regulator [Ameyamaea chiangmaiensis]|nr:TetR/AcrR family transcriptional regulator [Ameyamaea chiangmaiensis]MBS4075963.1 TetR/AcrR family transcriptional regulator [Ameyamaea chiangmaiensis]
MRNAIRRKKPPFLAVSGQRDQGVAWQRIRKPVGSVLIGNYTVSKYPSMGLETGLRKFQFVATEYHKTMDTRVRIDADMASAPQTERRCVGRPRALEECKRRDRIIDAATSVLCANGYHAASMDKVAQKSGMSKKTLYQMYPSKQDLFEAVIEDRIFRPKRVQVRGELGLEEQLVHLLIDMGNAIIDEDHLSLVRALIADASHSEDIRRILRNQIEISHKKNILWVWMHDQKAAGRLDIDDPQEAARQMFGMSVGELLLGSLMCCYDVPSPEERAVSIRRAVRLFLRAVAQSPQPSGLLPTFV